MMFSCKLFAEQPGQLPDKLVHARLLVNFYFTIHAAGIVKDVVLQGPSFYI